jgi:hypothetical protein
MATPLVKIYTRCRAPSIFLLARGTQLAGRGRRLRERRRGDEKVRLQFLSPPRPLQSRIAVRSTMPV